MTLCSQPDCVPSIYSKLCAVVFVLVNYGWHLVLLLVVLALLWTNLKPSLLRWLKKREERLEEENFDPVKAERFQDGMLQARERMQRELEEKALQHQAVVEEVGCN